MSIIELRNQTVTILGTFGDEHLGGEDITMRLEEYVKAEIENELGINVDENEKLKSQIHRNCEKVKRNLSTTEEVNFEIGLNDDNDYEDSITRNKFNIYVKIYSIKR